MLTNKGLQAVSAGSPMVMNIEDSIKESSEKPKILFDFDFFHFGIEFRMHFGSQFKFGFFDTILNSHRSCCLTEIGSNSICCIPDFLLTIFFSNMFLRSQSSYYKFSVSAILTAKVSGNYCRFRDRIAFLWVITVTWNSEKLKVML